MSSAVPRSSPLFIFAVIRLSSLFCGSAAVWPWAEVPATPCRRGVAAQALMVMAGTGSRRPLSISFSMSRIGWMVMAVYIEITSQPT